MEDFLKGILTIITTIFTALLVYQITNRRKKEKEMEDLINQKADKIDVSKKADKTYVDKELHLMNTTMKDTLRVNAERDAEIHAGMYRLMNSMDTKLDILLKKNAKN